jgi:hypothetical protein
MKKLFILLTFTILFACSNEDNDNNDQTIKYVNYQINSDDLNFKLDNFNVLFYKPKNDNNTQFFDEYKFYGISNGTFKKVPFEINNINIIDSTKVRFDMNVYNSKKINNRYDIVKGRYSKHIENHQIQRNDTIFNITGFSFQTSSEYLILDKQESKFIEIPTNILNQIDFNNLEEFLINNKLYCNTNGNTNVINFNSTVTYNDFVSDPNYQNLRLINNQNDYLISHIIPNSSTPATLALFLNSLNNTFLLPHDFGYNVMPNHYFKSINGIFYIVNNNQIFKIDNNNNTAFYSSVYDNNTNPANNIPFIDGNINIPNTLRNKTLVLENFIGTGYQQNYEFDHVNNLIQSVNLNTPQIEYVTFDTNFLYYITSNYSYNQFTLKKINLMDYSEEYSFPIVNTNYFEPVNIFIKNNGNACFMKIDNNLNLKFCELNNSNNLNEITLPFFVGGLFTIIE